MINITTHLVDWPPTGELHPRPLPKRRWFRVLLPRYELSRAGIPHVHQAVPPAAKQEFLVRTEGQVTHVLQSTEGIQNGQSKETGIGGWVGGLL